MTVLSDVKGRGNSFSCLQFTHGLLDNHHLITSDWRIHLGESFAMTQ